MPFLLINKPAGMTSHDVVDRVRKITGEQRVGHAGTLDPFATGLLIIGVGRESTKHLSTFLGMDKEYEAEIILGKTSPTLDPESTAEDLSEKDGQKIVLQKTAVIEAIKTLTGTLQQIPPMHSAIKVGGKKLYELARKGETVAVQPREVTVYDFSLLHELQDLITLPAAITAQIRCSSGTYIRALARDLGSALKTGGYLTALRRTAIGPYLVKNAKKLEELTPENWIDWSQNDMLRSGV